jgi:peptidoglycan hydrolase-like protein with peptidoglycan-binding domain
MADAGDAVRRLLIAGFVVIGLGSAALIGRATGSTDHPTASSAIELTTARVTRGDARQQIQIAGNLGYDGRSLVFSHLPAGVVTARARAGTLVRRGGLLFAVAGRAARLMYGRVPAYREFAAGMSDGSDVRQLERNLAALGFAPGTIDEHFSPLTTAAIERWQEALRLPYGQRNGRLDFGAVVFLPARIRVSRTVAAVGATASPGAAILTASSTTQVASAQLDADQRYLVHRGDKVDLALPGGAAPGRILRVGRIAASPAAGSDGPPTVPVTIGLAAPRSRADGGNLDHAPVEVSVTVAVHRDVLMVPVTALLARRGGGYQVRVVTAASSRLVDIEPGLYDDSAGSVEVSSAGLAEGMKVSVPRP